MINLVFGSYSGDIFKRFGVLIVISGLKCICVTLFRGNVRDTLQSLPLRLVNRFIDCGISSLSVLVSNLLAFGLRRNRV